MAETKLPGSNQYPVGPIESPCLQTLINKEVLSKRPEQFEVLYSESFTGIDVVYTLKDMSSERFTWSSRHLLIAAEFEANRFPEYAYKYARFVVQINLPKGNPPTIIQNYTAALQEDVRLLIYGKDGEISTEFGGVGKSLNSKVKAILDMHWTGKPGVNADPQNPFKVLELRIAARTPRNK